MKHLNLPPEAERVCEGQLPRVAQYAEILVSDGVLRGVIGPREGERIWERHLLNSAVILKRVPTHGEIADIGTGAGLPGIVLAILRPQQHVHLVDPLQRRIDFLADVCKKIDLTNVTLHRARAQDLAETLSVNCVVSRAVAPLAKLMSWVWPLVADGGVMLAMKGERADEEIEKARHTFAKYSDIAAPGPVVHLCGEGTAPTRAVELHKTSCFT